MARPSARSRDVSDWDLLERDTTSTKKGIWLSEPSGSGSHRRWLFKPCFLEIQRDSDGIVKLERRHGDDWSELVASSVGRQLGVVVAQYELAERGGEPGVLSPSFVRRGERLEHGNELLAGEDPNYSKHKKGVVRGYTVERVISALTPFRPPRGCEDWVTSAADAFAGYLVLDALVATAIGITRTGPSSQVREVTDDWHPPTTRHQVLVTRHQTRSGGSGKGACVTG